MKSNCLVLFIIFVLCLPVFSQHSFQSSFDDTDYRVILKEQGVDLFKKLLTVKRGEYIDINIEVYEKGKLVETYNQIASLIKLFEKDYGPGIELNYHVSRKDTTLFHRFYFFKQDDTLKIIVTVPGVQTAFMYNISKVKQGGIYEMHDVPHDLERKTLLGFYYGTIKDAWLGCPSGIVEEQLITKFDVVILIFGEKKKGDLLEGGSCPI